MVIEVLAYIAFGILDLTVVGSFIVFQTAGQFGVHSRENEGRTRGKAFLVGMIAMMLATAIAATMGWGGWADVNTR